MLKVLSSDVTFPLGFDFSLSGFVYIACDAVPDGILLHFLARALKSDVLKNHYGHLNF